MALQDYPRIAALFSELEQRKAEIEARTAPLRAEYNAIHAKISPELVRLRQLGKEMQAIEAGMDLSAICSEMAALARAAGGRALSDALRNGHKT